uniref:cobalamin-binding protein n=1 Tax=Castellaniella defragrans TaxID=75697 RepID=UPI00333E358B
MQAAPAPSRAGWPAVSGRARRPDAIRRCASRLAAILAAALLFAGPVRAPAADGAPPRVITLAPSTTELVYAAGAGTDIVGTVLSSDYPPAARAIPRIGDGIQFDQETILALRPTLVIGWQPSGGSQALAGVLQNLDIPLIYANPKSLDEIPVQVRDLGRRLGTSPIADRATDALQARIDALPSPSGPPLTVFIEVGVDPLYTLGRDPLIDDLLARCGGVNIYAGHAVAAPQVSVESVLRIDPDVVIVSPYGRQTLAARRAYWASMGLPAAARGRLYAIDPDWLHRPGPRLIDAAEAICGALRESRGG